MKIVLTTIFHEAANDVALGSSLLGLPSPRHLLEGAELTELHQTRHKTLSIVLFHIDHQPKEEDKATGGEWASSPSGRGSRSRED